MVTTAFLTDPECYPDRLTGQRQPAYSSPLGPDRLTAPAALPAPSPSPDHLGQPAGGSRGHWRRRTRHLVLAGDARRARLA